MAGVTKNEIPEIAAFMSDFWILVKDYWKPEENDEYWTSLLKAIHSLTAQYPYKFCRRMCVAYLDYLDVLEREQMDERPKRDNKRECEASAIQA